jgi:hypothetical protein
MIATTLIATQMAAKIQAKRRFEESCNAALLQRNRTVVLYAKEKYACRANFPQRFSHLARDLLASR